MDEEVRRWVVKYIRMGKRTRKSVVDFIAGWFYETFNRLLSIHVVVDGDDKKLYIRMH